MFVANGSAATLCGKAGQGKAASWSAAARAYSSSSTRTRATLLRTNTEPGSVSAMREWMASGEFLSEPRSTAIKMLLLWDACRACESGTRYPRRSSKHEDQILLQKAQKSAKGWPGRSHQRQRSAKLNRVGRQAPECFRAPLTALLQRQNTGRCVSVRDAFHGDAVVWSVSWA